MLGAAARTQRQRGQGASGRLTAAGCLLLLATLLPTVACGASTSVRVSVSVKPWLKFSAIPHVENYRVDEAALQRGYVDIPASLAVELATNLRDDVMLALVGEGPETIQVLDGGTATAGVLRFPAVASNTPIAREFGLRILLPPGVDKGVYPLRLQVSAALF